MSQESAIAFYEKLQNDEALIERINGMTPLEVQNLVRQEWEFDFTAEEMQQVIFDRHPELTDEELEAVVGGLSAETATIAFAGVAVSAVLVGVGVAGTLGIVTASVAFAAVAAA